MLAGCGRLNFDELRDGGGNGDANDLAMAGPAIQLALGYGHVCALHERGPVSCWGGDYDGELGDGGTLTRGTPALVTGLVDADHIAAGDVHTCVLRRGEVACWGDNAHGQLGDGTMTTSRTPVAVPGITDAV